MKILYIVVESEADRVKSHDCDTSATIKEQAVEEWLQERFPDCSCFLWDSKQGVWDALDLTERQSFEDGSRFKIVLPRVAAAQGASAEGVGPSGDVAMPDVGHGRRVKGPQALNDFWLALPRATWSDDDRVMTLADGTTFLGQPKLVNKLYRRDCYTGLEQEVEQIFTLKDSAGEPVNQALAIIGNPGIGKTVFGFLLLHRWAKQKRRVIVAKRGDCEAPTLLTADGAYELDRVALREELDNPDVRYLVDGLDPRKFGVLPRHAQMVLVTSPDPHLYHETWKRPGYVRRYMDVWEWDELLELWRSIFPQQPIVEVQERYDWWGGIPRYVLEKLDPADQKLLQEAIDAANLDSLIESSGLSASPSDTSHRVLQMRAEPDLKTRRMVMASVKVSEAVFDRLWEKEKDRLRTFLSSAAGEQGVETFRGNLFEGFCHRQLAQGGEFDVRDLSDPSSSGEKVKLPPSATPYVFDSWQEVRDRPDGEYFRPRSKTNEAVDSGMQPDALFQITVSKRHDLKCVGLTKAVNSMKQSRAVKVFFTVPPDKFEQFKAVPVGQGTGVASVRQAVKEYALKVGFDHLPA